MDEIKNFIKNKKVFIISPHLDDAVLSCGGLILDLKITNNISVVNVFTEGNSGPYTLSGKKFLKMTGQPDALQLYKLRKAEDEKALSKLGVTFINLGFQEALFRKKKPSVLGKYIPELSHTYPTFRFHIMKNVKHNDPVKEKLKAQLKHLIPSDAVVIAPFGVGNHADHVLVRSVCEEIFGKVILYSDFPYNLSNQLAENPFEHQKTEITPDHNKKLELIKCYKSQLNCLFPSGIIPEHKEIYYFQNNI